MSNDEKRAGIRDIRTLRERLGKVKQGVTPKENAPQSSNNSIIPPPDDDGSETATDVPVAARSPQENGSTRDGTSPTNASADASRGSVDMPKENFAHPLQLGEYKQARPSLQVTPEDLQEIEEYEKKYSGRLKTMIALGLVCLIGGLGFGYLGGSAMDARDRYNNSIDVAKQVSDALSPTFASISKIDDVLQSEVKRMEANQKKLQGAVNRFKDAKKKNRKKALQAARQEILKFKAVENAGIKFQVVSTKLPAELELKSEGLLQRAQFLPKNIRQQLATFLIETDRCFRLITQYQQTASAIAKLEKTAEKRFGPVLAVDLSGNVADPAFKNLPRGLQRGEIVRFNRGFVDSMVKAPIANPGKDIALFGLSVPDDGPSSKVPTKKVVALSTRAAINVTAQVYPVINRLLDVQFQELEELSKSLKTATGALKSALGDLQGKDKKFTL